MRPYVWEGRCLKPGYVSGLPSLVPITDAVTDVIVVVISRGRRGEGIYMKLPTTRL